MMTVRRLLKSWATPPATWPRASIRWASRKPSCSLRRSVTSTASIKMAWTRPSEARSGATETARSRSSPPVTLIESWASTISSPAAARAHNGARCSMASPGSTGTTNPGPSSSQPNMAAANWFQTRTRPPRSTSTIAAGVASTRARHRASRPRNSRYSMTLSAVIDGTGRQLLGGRNVRRLVAAAPRVDGRRSNRPSVRPRTPMGATSQAFPSATDASWVWRR